MFFSFLINVAYFGVKVFNGTTCRIYTQAFWNGSADNAATYQRYVLAVSELSSSTYSVQFVNVRILLYMHVHPTAIYNTCISDLALSIYMYIGSDPRRL